MIAGNPNVGKKLATAAVAIFVMMIILTVLIALRKRSAPAKEPPLHPSTIELVMLRE